MKLTYFGHSCFSVLAGGKTLLFDPFITPNELARTIDVDKVQADYIFVSHGHYDRTTDVVRIAKRTGAKVLGNWELYDWFNKNGLKNTHPINPGGQFTFDFGTVKSFIAQHSSSLPDGGSPKHHQNHGMNRFKSHFSFYENLNNRDSPDETSPANVACDIWHPTKVGSAEQ